VHRALLLLSSAVVVAAGQPAQRTASGDVPQAVRFHHLHYRVDDPGDALGVAADLFKGTRLILPGLGVGVRVGREYVLLDRPAVGSDDVPRGRAPADVYAEAASWLTSQGLIVFPRSLAETAVSAPLADAALDHVAFAADDLRAASAAIKQKPLATTEDATRFALPSGAIVEIVRDTDRPDAYWCPMHPDVRLPVAGVCSRCGMALVPIPPPRIGEYRFDVFTTPRRGGGVSSFRFVVRDPETGAPVTSFIDVHERPFHLFVISRNLATFSHVHPELRADGSFELRHELPAGEYILIGDFLPAGGTPQVVQRAIVTPGYAGALFGPAPALQPGPVEQVRDGVRIKLESAAPRPRRTTLLTFHVSDPENGSPITDLEPYLGASGHLLIVSQDATAAIHAHPEGAATAGPTVSFDAVFPAPGRYKLWAQFQRKGRVVTVPFVIDVPPE
jgi:Heavy metal binding domain